MTSQYDLHSAAGDLAVGLAVRNTDIRHGAAMKKRRSSTGLMVERCLELSTVTGRDLAAVVAFRAESDFEKARVVRTRSGCGTRDDTTIQSDSIRSS